MLVTLFKAQLTQLRAQTPGETVEVELNAKSSTLPQIQLQVTVRDLARSYLKLNPPSWLPAGTSLDRM